MVAVNGSIMTMPGLSKKPAAYGIDVDDEWCDHRIILGGNMANLIDGKLISTQIKDELKEEVAELKKKGIEGCLAVIQVGNDSASSVYVRNKKKACEYVGIKSLSYELAEETTEDEILKLIEKLNADASVNGILCQLSAAKAYR
mgnify:CR=1 FL=1